MWGGESVQGQPGFVKHTDKSDLGITAPNQLLFFVFSTCRVMLATGLASTNSTEEQLRSKDPVPSPRIAERARMVRTLCLRCLEGLCSDTGYGFTWRSPAQGLLVLW